jgi:uncharacterized protein
MSRPRLSPLEAETLATLASRLRDQFGSRVDDLRLFGSRARGEGRADSDLDVLVLIDRLTPRERRAVQDLAFDVGLSSGLVLSPLVYDSRQWRHDSPLAAEIARDGAPL